tara:strand:- start:124 stop:240 length:117 start_codon:yes stop_codon:yes gene_type:complete
LIVVVGVVEGEGAVEGDIFAISKTMAHFSNRIALPYKY